MCLVALAAACESGDAAPGFELERVEDRPSTTALSTGVPSTPTNGPVVEVDLAAALPAIDGVRYAEADEPTPLYYEVLRLPPGAPLLRRAIEAGSAAVGFLTVVGPPDDMDDDDFTDSVVDAFFATPAEIVTDETNVDESILVVTNSTDPRWTAVGEEFVMEAAIDEEGRWEWFWDGLLWIVEASADARSFTERLIGVQHEIAPPDPYDTSVTAGELLERFADLETYTYLDLPRSELTANLNGSVAGPCQDQWLAFGVTHDPDDLLIGADNLFMQMAVVGARCDGFPEDFRATFMSYPRAHDETIGGVPAIVSDTVVAWLEDGIAFVANSEDPATVVAYRPFLDAFIQVQADLPAVG